MAIAQHIEPVSEIIANKNSNECSKKTMKIHRATVSFTEKDIDRIEELKRKLNMPTKAQTLSAALILACEIVKQQEKGTKIIFESDGNQKEMIIPGLK